MSAPIAELAAFLSVCGMSVENLRTAMELAQAHAEHCVRMSADIPRNSTESPQTSAETTDERRRRKDRERKADKRGKSADTQKHALTISFLPSKSQEELPKEVSKKERAPAKNRGERLPDDWQPKPQDLAMAETALGVDGATNELAKFRDYWRAKPGAGGLKADWDATWRVWLRSNIERLPRGNGGGTPRPGSRDDMRERTHNALEKLDRYIDAHADDKSGGGETHQEDARRLPFAESA